MWALLINFSISLYMYDILTRPGGIFIMEMCSSIGELVKGSAIMVFGANKHGYSA